MPAWCHGLVDRAVLIIDEVLDRKYLLPRNNVVVPGGEQEQRAAQAGEIGSSAERHEATVGEPVILEQALDDLQIIGTGQIQGPCVPIAEAGFQPPKRSRARSGGALQ